MEVKDYMSTNVITVTPETTVMKALDLMKEHDIHRLPVVEDGKLVGLLTEELVAGHSPSMATSLSMHELNYLLNKTTASEIMQKQVLTVKAHTLLEEAASLMRQQNIGVLPVVDARGHVEGIITDKDIFDAFIEISGYNTPGSRLFIEINEDKPGPLEEISNVLREKQRERFRRFLCITAMGKCKWCFMWTLLSPMKWRTLSHKKAIAMISAMRK